MTEIAWINLRTLLIDKNHHIHIILGPLTLIIIYSYFYLILFLQTLVKRPSLYGLIYVGNNSKLCPGKIYF